MQSYCDAISSLHIMFLPLWRTICNLVMVIVSYMLKWGASMQLTNLRRLILAHAASFSCSHQYNNSNCVCLVARPVSCKVLCLLYQAYIMPILDYCDVVWSPCSAFYTRHLERVHSRFVSSIPSSTSAVLDLKLPYSAKFWRGNTLANLAN